MNAHFLKDRYKDLTTDELTAVLSNNLIFDPFNTDINLSKLRLREGSERMDLQWLARQRPRNKLMNRILLLNAKGKRIALLLRTDSAA